MNAPGLELLWKICSTAPGMSFGVLLFGIISGSLYLFILGWRIGSIETKLGLRKNGRPPSEVVATLGDLERALMNSESRLMDKLANVIAMTSTCPIQHAAIDRRLGSLENAVQRSHK